AEIQIAKETDEMDEYIDQQLVNGVQLTYNKIIQKRKQEFENEDSSNRKADTSNTFGFMIEYIECNPNVKQKLLEKLSTVFCGDRNKISFDKLTQLKYIEAVINETLRMSPQGLTIVRTNNKEVDVVGCKWQASTQFRINIPAIHQDPSLWHNPDKFNLDGQKGNIKKNSNLNFGIGRRICPGRFQAINVLKL
ncbi:10264_t:CDS:2, partial [Ambispora gerdemannii]